MLTEVSTPRRLWEGAGRPVWLLGKPAATATAPGKAHAERSFHLLPFLIKGEILFELFWFAKTGTNVHPL